MVRRLIENEEIGFWSISFASASRAFSPPLNACTGFKTSSPEKGSFLNKSECLFQSYGENHPKVHLTLFGGCQLGLFLIIVANRHMRTKADLAFYWF